MIDAADFYGMGQDEMLIREALKGGKRQRAFVAVKFGSMRGSDLKSVQRRCAAEGDEKLSGLFAATASAPTMSISSSHRRVDPEVPIEDTIGAIADMVKAGYVRRVGVSEASAKRAARACGASDGGIADRVAVFPRHRARRPAHIA